MICMYSKSGVYTYIYSDALQVMMQVEASMERLEVGNNVSPSIEKGEGGIIIALGRCVYCGSYYV